MTLEPATVADIRSIRARAYAIIRAAGIEIACTPFAGPGGPLTLGKYRTEVRFPEGFSAEQKVAVLDAIAKCAVKEVVRGGANIEFIIAEA